MNFIAQVEENLRDLGTEARKKHPGVKEASERAILTLRSLQTQYVSAVRAATTPSSSSSFEKQQKQHPTTSLFRSQDVLRPFLLACNYPDASYKLLNIALGAIQFLISGDAVCPGDAVNIVRVLGIQACASSSSCGMSSQSSGVGGGEEHHQSMHKSSAMNLPQSMMLGIVNAAAGAYSSSTSAVGGAGNSNNPLGNHNRSQKEEEMILVKVLQTLTIVVASRSLEFGEEVLSQGLLVCMAMMWSGSSSASSSYGGQKAKLKIHRGGSGAGVIQGGQNATKIRRFAIKTLKQVLSILFERVSENNNASLLKQQNSTNAMAATKYAATRIVIDLCTLCGKRDYSSSQQKTHYGPFALSLGTIHTMKSRCIPPPPRSFCLELLDMILSQQPTLFTSLHQEEEEDTSLFILIKTRIYPLVKSILQDELCKSSSSIDFCLLVRCIMLSCTIVQHNMNKSSTNAMKEECLDIVMIFCNFITSSVDRYREADSFEDGFVYTDSYIFSVSSTSNNTSSHQNNSSSNANNNIENGNLLLSTYLQWRTSLSISALYTIFQSSSTTSFTHYSNTSIAYIAKSLSNFYIISTSNKQGILQLVQVLEQSSSSSSLSNKKDNSRGGVFDKALEYCIYAEEWDNTTTTTSDNHYNSVDKNTNALDYYPKLNKGDAIWISFQTLFTISKTSSLITSKRTKDSPQTTLLNNSVLLQEIFTPSLSLYVHTLRRFPGQKDIVPMTLSGFLALANSSLTQHQYSTKNKNERNALISSLCKITTDVTTTTRLSSSMKELRDYQVESLSCLFYIVHVHYNSISYSDWNIILYTLHQLSTYYPIYSSCLSKDIYPTSIALSGALTRFSSFSTCFDVGDSSGGCLNYFLEACMELSFALFRQSSGGSITVMNESSNAGTIIQASAKGNDDRIDDENVGASTGQAQLNQSLTLGNKIISLAGRAFGGVSSESFDDTTPHHHPTPPTRSSRVASSQNHHHTPSSPHSKKKLGDDARQSILSNIIRITQSSSSIIKDANITKQLPISLLLLVDCTLLNLYRFGEFGGIVIPHLCDVATMFPDVRQFVIDILCHLIVTRLSIVTTTTSNNANGVESTLFSSLEEEVSSSKKNKLERIPKGNPTPEYYFVYEEVKEEEEDDGDDSGDSVNNDNEVKDSSSSTKEKTELSQEKLLEPLCTSISTTGDKDYAICGLNALYIILEGVGHNLNHAVWPIIISAIMALSGCSPDFSPLLHNNPQKINRTSISSWSSCSTLAFRCLRLIVDDFLDHLPQEDMTTKITLLDCCAAFGSSKHDVNTSLTATGMLWTIADQDAKYTSLEHVLSKLAFLACDGRAEVRNCSVNTLYSCIVGLGHRFTPEQWKSCLEGTIFGVLDLITSAGDNTNTTTQDSSSPSTLKKKKKNQDVSSRYNVTVHHTRDSKSKQWRTTQVLALRGLERVLRQFFGQLLSTLETPTSTSQEEKALDEEQQLIPWFEACWKRIIHLAYKCASESSGGRENLDLRLTGVDILVLCAQLSCRDGVSAAALPIRVGTNMQVINGALRRVPTSRKSASNLTTTSSTDLDNDTTSTTTTTTLVEHRKLLFISSFETLESFTMGLNDEEEECETELMFIETARLQVLNKISNGLAQLYDCCKDYELSPIVTFTTKNYEARFVNMVHSLTLLAVSEKNHKFLTQAQRMCLDLLRKMASASSSKAFEKLAVIGGKYFIWFPMKRSVSDEEGSDDSYNQDDTQAPTVELVEQEAAKAVSEAFIEDSVPDIVKTSVLCMILRKSYTEIRGFSNDNAVTTDDKLAQHPSGKKDDGEYSTTMSDEIVDGAASYDFLVPIVIGGLKSAFVLEKSCNDEQPSSSPSSDNNYPHSIVMNDVQEVTIMLNSLWNRVLSMLSSLLSPSNNTFAPHTDQILQILMCCISVVPNRVYTDLGRVLFEACNKSADIAKVHYLLLKPDEQEITACKDALKIFETCFVGLTQCGPDIPHLEVIAQTALTNILEDMERKSKMKTKSYTSTFHEYNKLIKGNDGISATRSSNSSTTDKNKTLVNAVQSSDFIIDVELELAISVCEALGTSTSNLVDATLTLFPQLCRLINAHDDRLSAKAGIVLASLNLAGIISKANKETTEYKARLVDVQLKNEELEAEVQLLRSMNEVLQEKVNIMSK